MSWVHAVIDTSDAQSARTVDFWSRALGWPIGDPGPGPHQLASFEPPGGTPYVHLCRDEGPTRVHLHAEGVDADGAVALGAVQVAGPDEQRSLRSPGGLPFCVLPAVEHRPPPATVWPDQHSSRLVQVCIDSPADRHDREVSFWRELLGARWVDSPATEFAGKWHDDAGSPVQLLFQKLDEATGPVRAHLDLGTDNLPAEVSRLRELGAEDVGPGRGGWHVLRDPTGMTFCVTLNSPEPSTHRDLG